MATFRDRINILWEEAKDNNYRITQKEFAEKFRATRSQLQGWLSGAGEPDTEMMKVIATISNVSVDWLVGNCDDRNPYHTIAAHRSDDPMDDLPQEAIEKIEEFKELMRLKYKKQ